MSSVDIDTALAWRGRTVRDPEGEKVGTLGDVYLDRETDLPEWASIRTGLFGRHHSYVPLHELAADGDDLRVPYSKAEIEAAPRVDPDVALSEEEERVLYEHYGRDYGTAHGDAAPAHADASPGHAHDDAHDDALGAPEAPRPAAATSDAGDPAEMVRSEEEVEVREGPMRPAERVRLRKVLVTEHEERTIPVRKEVVQLDTEPPPSGRIEHVEDVGDADRPR